MPCAVFVHLCTMSSITSNMPINYTPNGGQNRPQSFIKSLVDVCEIIFNYIHGIRFIDNRAFEVLAKHAQTYALCTGACVREQVL